MNFRDWWRFYSQIVEDFNFDPARDYVSSLELSALLGTKSSASSLQGMSGKQVTIVGNGPSLEGLLGSIPRNDVIVADSAIDTFLSGRSCPEYIVTDLDGNIGKIRKCGTEGTTLIVHAHGDNMDKLGSIVPAEGFQVCGTTQNMPLWNIFNFGGFTDGDRAAFIADLFGASSITLVGFDFKNPNRKKPSDPAVKKKKLRWAKMLLSSLAESRGSELTEGDFIEI